MKTKKYFIISTLALLACSCQDEDYKKVQPTPGQDVKFGASLEQSATRTIYGDEINDGSKDVFPINWINGDEVVVFSPDCASNGGVGKAIYKVNVGEENSGKQNYANSLDKTGEIGVRWGNNTTGSFYSIYPASSLYSEVSSDCKTLTLTMPAQQDNTFERTASGIKAYSDMRACFMYAYTQNVSSGETVNLKYKPISTAIRFKVQGPLNNDNGPVTINYVRLYAPTGTNINGTYEFKDVTDTSTGIPVPKRGLNYVTMNVADSDGAYLTLSAGESVELNAFLLTGHEITINDKWYFEVAISDGTVFQKHIVTEGGENENLTLKPGMIHKLPDLPPLTASGTWNVSNWMKNIQRNVYLSEISIPGSWYSLDQDYQSDIRNINGQYNLGVRAFHFDTRWIAERSGIINLEYTPTALGVAGTANNYDADDGRFLRSTDNPMTFETALGQVVNNVKSDEYMVVMCTFAQGSAVRNDWRQAISDACDKYTGKIVEASSLNENTVVGDVLGKVIVIVNTYTPGEVTNSKCMFFNMSLLLAENEFKNNPYYEKPLYWYNTTNSGITMYGTHAQATYVDRDGEYDSDRQSYVPSLTERKTKLQNILTWSQNNYAKGNSVHNYWIYMGLGGYVPRQGLFGDDNYHAVSTDDNGLNVWLGAKVEEMYDNEAYYPVGIVLMNFVGSSYTSKNLSLVQRILEMNNMYRKAYDPRRSPVDGAFIDGSTGGNRVQSAAPGYSSGMKDNQTDAIGWTRCR